MDMLLWHSHLALPAHRTAQRAENTAAQSHQHCVITGGPRLAVPCSMSQKQGSLSRGDESCHTVTCSKGPALHKHRELLPSPGGQAGLVPALMSKHLLEMLEKGSFFSAQPAQGNPPRSTGGAGCRNIRQQLRAPQQPGWNRQPPPTAQLSKFPSPRPSHAPGQQDRVSAPRRLCLASLRTAGT